MDVQGYGLVALPPLAARLAGQWHFEPIEELPGGHCSRVFASADQVLKVPFQGEEMISGWKMALLLSSNIGPKVFEHEPESGALLMERILPGAKLSQSGKSETECLTIFKSFRDEIEKLPSDGLMPLSDYFAKPNSLARELLATSIGQVPLHGDLHHENILLGKFGWVLIDPKGLVGDPSFKAAAFMHNPVDELLAHGDLELFLKDRIQLFASTFNWDPWRVWGWSVSIFDDDMAPDDPWHRILEAMIRVEPSRRHLP